MLSYFKNNYSLQDILKDINSWVMHWEKTFAEDI